ncbi:MAG: LacI family transcriptional regulator [Armatimonadota bacterium]|nr:LacI family transcriptional regulator [Armatimonadota bacterium]
MGDQATVDKKRVTLHDVARQVGVHPMTVSHALKGTGRIAAETQQRVRDAARELGYRPNLSARAVRTGRFNCAALIQPLHGIYLPPGLLLGLSQELHRHDMHLVVSEAPQAELGEAEFLPRVVRELAADGLLVNVLGDVPASFEAALRELNTPAVWVNTNRPFDCVHPDDQGGARRVTEHLLKLGHRRIGYVQPARRDGEEPHYSIHARRAGYEEAMRAARLKPAVFELPPQPTYRQEILTDRREEVATELLATPQRPTAIVAYELEVAMPLYHAALGLGLRVPGDLSLAMFHGDLNRHIGVPMTTAHTHMWQVGGEAVQMLMEKIEHPGAPLPSRAVPIDLFEGSTCGPPS